MTNGDAAGKPASELSTVADLIARADLDGARRAILGTGHGECRQPRARARPGGAPDGRGL